MVKVVVARLSLEILVLLDGCQSSKEMIIGTCHALPQMRHGKKSIISLYLFETILITSIRSLAKLSAL